MFGFQHTHQVAHISGLPSTHTHTHIPIITDGFELPRTCWKLRPYPLEEHPLLLIAESSLEPQITFKNKQKTPTILKNIYTLKYLEVKEHSVSKYG